MFGNEQSVPESDIPFDMLPEETAESLSARHSMSVFPVGLFDRTPGPELAAFLSMVDPAQLSGHDQVLVLQAHQKLVSHFQAKVYEDIGALTQAMVGFDGDLETGMEATALELRAALRLTRRMADDEIDLADNLKHRLPVVGETLSSGEIDIRRARILVDGTAHLTESQARRVVDRVIERAPELTTGQLGARVRKLCMTVEPEEAENRYQQAVGNRRVVREATIDGTANLQFLDCPPNRAGEAFNRINHIAKSLCGSGETRTMDQLRTDVALDLLCGRADYKTTGRGTVNLHVDLETLAELADAPGELAGFGPVVADIARQVSEEQEHSEWRFRVTNPKTGQPVHIGTTRRRPNKGQQRHVELRDLTCVSPGCRMPATECDLDHTTPWNQSQHTSIFGLAPLCRSDHVGRHKYDWTYKPLPGGDYQWTSRLGHTYTTSGRPPPNPD